MSSSTPESDPVAPSSSKTRKAYKKTCAHCNKRITEIKHKKIYAVKAESVWPRLQHYLKNHPGHYNKGDFLCGKFQGELRTYCRKTKFSPEQQPIDQVELGNVLQESLELDQLMSQDQQILEANDIEEQNLLGVQEVDDKSQRARALHQLEVAEPCASQNSLLAHMENSHHFSNDSPVQPEAVYSQSLLSCSEPLFQKVKLQNKRILLEKVSTIRATQRKCSICPGLGPDSRRTPPDSAIDQLWLSEEILVPKAARMCRSHLEGGIFSEEAKQKIRSKAILGVSLNSNELTSFITRLSTAARQTPFKLDFDETTSETTYQKILGVSKEHFEIMLGYIENQLLESKNRSTRNALAITLAKLRLGVSQTVIGELFGIVHQSVISQTIHRVTSLITESFVAMTLWSKKYENSSPSCPTRADILTNHNPSYARRLLKVKRDNLVLVLDGTYVYVEKTANHSEQLNLYSSHKYRHLVKFMMVTTPDGFIVQAEGPFRANQNDAEILRQMLAKEDGLKGFLIPGDVLVMDRGFRNICDELKTLGYIPLIPDHLNGRKQFTTEEANRTRILTLVRWEVEAINGRIKNCFDFFDNTVPLSYLPIIGDLFRVCCSIINAFQLPTFLESKKHETILSEVHNRLGTTNTFAEKLHDAQLDTMKGWKKADGTIATDFPKLSEDDMFLITIGIFQTRKARDYINEHMKEDGMYQIWIRMDAQNIVRARIQSRFHRNDKHTVVVEFEPSLTGRSAIVGHYCLCQQGARTLGVCAHIASVIYYLGNIRYGGQISARRLFFSKIFNDDSGKHSNQKRPKCSNSNLNGMAIDVQQYLNDTEGTADEGEYLG